MINIENISSINGVPIYLDKNLGDYKQRRTHKRKRINKKWLKRFGKIFIPSKEILIMKNEHSGNTMIAHPDTWKIIECQLNRFDLKQPRCEKVTCYN